ncbi:MAG: DUF3179 domain-containing (seleno)protein [Bryobacteraceae bacterium]
MSRRGVWIVLLTCLVGAFASLVYPIYVIRPFRHQGPEELQAALAVLQWRVWVVVPCAVVSAMAAWLLWDQRRVMRVVAVVCAVLACGFAVLTRVNVYEKMFHPIDAPAFVAARDAKFDADEMVLAVTLNGTARAYPVRPLTYHHIANDWVNGAALAATY